MLGDLYWIKKLQSVALIQACMDLVHFFKKILACIRKGEKRFMGSQVQQKHIRGCVKKEQWSYLIKEELIFTAKCTTSWDLNAIRYGSIFYCKALKSHLNSQQNKLSYTCKKELDKKYPFILDVIFCQDLATQTQTWGFLFEPLLGAKVFKLWYSWSDHCFHGCLIHKGVWIGYALPQTAQLCALLRNFSADENVC